MPTGRPSDYSDETVSIYALRDPDSGRIRYIGKAKNPSQRFKGHLADSARKRAPSADWIRSLQAQGKKPVLDVITECPASRWQEFEKEAISILKEEGVKLLNLADGGDQPYCPP